MTTDSQAALRARAEQQIVRLEEGDFSGANVTVQVIRDLLAAVDQIQLFTELRLLLEELPKPHTRDSYEQTRQRLITVCRRVVTEPDCLCRGDHVLCKGVVCNVDGTYDMTVHGRIVPQPGAAGQEE